MAKGCEFHRVSFARQNGIEYPQSAQAGDVAQDVVQLEIHLTEGLLHVHGMFGRHLNEALPVAP
jgi:hypothetical protein